MNNEGYAQKAKNGLLLGVVLICLGFLGIEYILEFEIKDNTGVYLAYVCFGVALSIAIFFCFVAIFLDNDEMDFSSKTSSLLKKYLNRENKLIYNRFGFDWRIGKDFYWLEIHKLG